MNTKVMKVEEIIQADYNPRVMLRETDFEYKALEKSMDEFGLVVPLIVNERTGVLVSGHQRLNVMKNKGVIETEVVIIDVDEAHEKGLCIAMNKTGGLWDYGMLADILEELRESDLNQEITGFTDAEISELLGELQGIDIDDIEIKHVEKKAKDENVIPCVIGEYKFDIDAKTFDTALADIREKVGFAKVAVEQEFQRRLFRWISED